MNLRTAMENILLHHEVHQKPRKVTISQPSENDILCGKDKTFAKHTGNQIFRSLIEDWTARYKCVHAKQEKMKITKEIVNTLQQKHSARFLKKAADGTWEEISNLLARDKVSHALRFAASQCGTNSSVASKSCKKKSKQARRFHRRMSSDSSYSSSDSSSRYSSSLSSTSSTTNHSSQLFSSANNHKNQNVSGGEPQETGIHLYQRQQHFLRASLQTHMYQGDVRFQDAEEYPRESTTISSSKSYTSSATIVDLSILNASVGNLPDPSSAMIAEPHRRYSTTSEAEFQQQLQSLQSQDLEELFNEPLFETEWENAMALSEEI